MNRYSIDRNYIKDTDPTPPYPTYCITSTIGGACRFDGLQWTQRPDGAIVVWSGRRSRGYPE